MGGHRDPHPHPCLRPPHGHVCQRQVPPIRWEGQVGVAGSRYGEGDVDGSGDGGGLHLGPGLAVLRVGTKQWNVREGANKSDTKAAERRGCC